MLGVSGSGNVRVSGSGNVSNVVNVRLLIVK